MYSRGAAVTEKLGAAVLTTNSRLRLAQCGILSQLNGVLIQGPPLPATSCRRTQTVRQLEIAVTRIGGSMPLRQALRSRRAPLWVCRRSRSLTPLVAALCTYTAQKVNAKESSSMFAPRIAQITFYYNKSTEGVQSSGAAACTSDYQVGNCTLPRIDVNYIAGEFKRWEINATGLVQPALSKAVIGSGSGAWKVGLFA